MENKEKDRWDKADIILKPVGGFLTALAVAALGFFGSNYLKAREAAERSSRERMQATEMRVRLYSELMSKREEAESALRKDMFKSIIESFLKPGSASLEEKVLNLELLAYNFHESLNLKPLFIHLRKHITFAKNYKKATKQEYIERLNKVAREVTRKQLLVLEGAGEKFDRTIDLESLRKTPGGIPLKEATLTLDNIERSFKVFVLEADPKMKEIKVRLEIRTPKESEEVDIENAEFWVGFFDFPMIDNTRLSHDQRCAIVLNEFEESGTHITVIYFPGSYASLKEKPYYEEVRQQLLLGERETK
ncbi:hypothetical protein DRP98_05210 [candidate division KSB1 bacterium]|nr:MAG: hypothetical protein DRP98_05210 [candidate division KSB1 bacterium]RLI00600.1 MAG: hypothetical protein DRO38_06190 [Candidatus Bathyarchaeota archaeon]